MLCFFLFYSCLSIKPAATKSGKNYFETFYVGEEGTQYYIKPLLFKDVHSNDELVADITFRYKNEIKDSATVNISIKSQTIFKTIDSLKISNRFVLVENNKTALLYNEKKSKVFESRFTTKISLEDVAKLFKTNEWDLVINNKTKRMEFKANRKTKKVINSLRENVFVIM